MIILSGPASQNLAASLTTKLNVKQVPVSSRRFPDGESSIRIESSVENEEVVIVQTTSPPQDERLMQLFQIASAAKDHGAQTITAVIPYLAYSRQDRIFLSGEVFSAKLIVSILKTCGVDRIITVNAHNPAVLKSFSLPITDLSAFPMLAEHFRGRGFDGAVSLSMGKKGLATSKETAAILKGEYDYVETHRDRRTGQVDIQEPRLKVKNKIVIFFDDIISSGGTMAKAIAHARTHGAKQIYVACVHPLLINDARERIIANGAEEIIGTDTVPSPVSVVSVAPLIANAFARRESKS